MLLPQEGKTMGASGSVASKTPKLGCPFGCFAGLRSRDER
jgi:hypothetical protein